MATKSSTREETHPRYWPSNFREGHNGYVKVTAGPRNAFITSDLTIINDSRTTSKTVSGKSVTLDATAMIGAQEVPVKYIVDGIAQSSEDFVPKNVNLPVGEHTIQTIVTANGSTTTSSRVSTVYSVDFQLTSPVAVTVLVGQTVSITGHVIVTPTPLLGLTLTSRVNGAPNGSVTIQPNGDFQMNYTPAAVGSYAVELTTQLGDTFTYFRNVDIIAQNDSTPKISVLAPVEFIEVQHNEPIDVSVSCFTQDVVPVDLTGDIVGDISGFPIAMNPLGHLVFTPSALGLAAGTQSLLLSLSSDPSVERNFEFTTYIAEINFIGLSPTYSIDDFESISVQATSLVNYFGVEQPSIGFLKMYLDDSDAPFSYGGGSGSFPIPNPGPHTITALLFKREVLGDPSWGAVTFVEKVWNFEVLASTKPQIFNVEASLVRALVESYTLTAQSVASDQTTDLTSQLVWTFNGVTQPITGGSILADNLIQGENDIQVEVTDGGKTTTYQFAITANAVVDCFAGDNLVTLIDGRVVKLENLEAGMVLRDYLDNPVAITGLRKMNSSSRQFVEIRIPGYKHGLIITKEHPILYQNSEIPARLVVGQPCVDIHLSETQKSLYHIETERKTFVQIEGVCELKKI